MFANVEVHGGYFTIAAATAKRHMLATSEQLRLVYEMHEKEVQQLPDKVW